MVWLPSLRQRIVHKQNQDKFLSTSFCSIQNEFYNNLIPKTSETKIMERVFVVVVGFFCVCVCVIQITYQTRPSLHPHSKPDCHLKVTVLQMPTSIMLESKDYYKVMDTRQHRRISPYAEKKCYQSPRK